MTFVTRLADLVERIGGAAPPAGAPDTADGEARLAAAALLVHVARVDGRVDGPERLALVVLLADRFGLRDEVASALVNRADGFDREVDDVATLIELVEHDADAADRRRLLGMAYRIAAADGRVGEFEEDLCWRMGRLLGFDDRAIDDVRREALGPDRRG